MDGWQCLGNGYRCIRQLCCIRCFQQMAKRTRLTLIQRADRLATPPVINNEESTEKKTEKKNKRDMRREMPTKMTQSKARNDAEANKRPLLYKRQRRATLPSIDSIAAKGRARGQSQRERHSKIAVNWNGNQVSGTSSSWPIWAQ